MSTPAKKKVRKYLVDYLKFGFVAYPADERLALCLLCEHTLCNESMKPAKLEAHLKTKHGEHAKENLAYFQRLKTKSEQRKQKTITTMFRAQTSRNDSGLVASYELSLLVAKTGSAHTVGEDLLKPALTIFSKTVLQRNDDPVSVIPLSNDTVRRRIDEMASDVESQLVNKLQACKFSVQLDESTVRDSDALLLAYVRYIEDGAFHEEMLFCDSLATTTTAKDIYQLFTQFLNDKEIPISNMLSCAADGAPAMMGKRNGCLMLLKKENPELLIVHCVIHRENLVAKNLSPELNVIMKAVIKCINYIKANAKTERLFKMFCQDSDEQYIRLLLHTEVRWLSKGRCLQRFVELYDTLLEFCNDSGSDVMDPLRGDDARVMICYLADIFGKLNGLNCQLQGADKTLIDAKSKVFGFVSKLDLWQKEISRRDFTSFSNLCQSPSVSDYAITIICNHVNTMIDDFRSRFQDLQDMKFPDWITQPFLCSLQDVERSLQNEMADLQNDVSAQAIYKSSGQLMWLSKEVWNKYPGIATLARKLLLPFPTSYLVECGFSAVADILTKKRNRLDICDRGDLRLKLSKLQPSISELVSKHQAQGSH